MKRLQICQHIFGHIFSYILFFFFLFFSSPLLDEHRLATNKDEPCLKKEYLVRVIIIVKDFWVLKDLKDIAIYLPIFIY